MSTTTRVKTTAATTATDSAVTWQMWVPCLAMAACAAAVAIWAYQRFILLERRARQAERLAEIGSLTGGLAHEIKQALATYTESGGTGKTAIDQKEAVALMLEKHEICCGLFHAFDWSRWVSGKPGERLGLLPRAQEHILALRDGKDRLLAGVLPASR